MLLAKLLMFTSDYIHFSKICELYNNYVAVDAEN